MHKSLFKDNTENYENTLISINIFQFNNILVLLLFYLW